MEFQTIRIPYKSKGDWVHIEPISDIHVGSAFHDKVKFKEVVERIRDDPNRYTFIMGDIFDCTLPNNKFYDEQARDFTLKTVEDQYQYLVKILSPIKHKILGMHTGNHDERLRKQNYNDMVLRLANDLGVKYLGYLALSRLQFDYHGRKTTVDVFTAHGGYSGMRVGGNLNNSEDIASSFDADIYLTGHTHQIVVDKKVRIAINHRGQLYEKTQIFGVCGSFLRAYNLGSISYPEYKIMRTTRVGTITISIHPWDWRLQAHE